MRVRGSKQIISFLSFCLLLIMLSLPLGTKAVSSANDNDFYWLEPKGMGTFESTLGWVDNEGKNILVFAEDYPKGWNVSHRVVSFVLKPPDKTDPVKAMLEIPKGDIFSGHALLTSQDDSSGKSADAAPIGLLFIAYKNLNKFNQVHFAVAPFDTAGNKTSDFEIIKTYDSKERNTTISKATIFATRNDSTVAVTMSAIVRSTIKPKTTAQSKAFFVETDLTGNEKYNPKEVKIPSKGADKEFLLFFPEWDFNRWFIPGTSVNYNKNSSSSDMAIKTELAGSSLYILTARPKKANAAGVKLKLRTIEDDNQAQEKCAYGGVQIFSLPKDEKASLARKPNKPLLFYQKKTFFDEDSQDPREYDTTHYGRSVKKTGKALAAKEIDFPTWIPDLKKKAGDKTYFSDEILSRAIPQGDGSLHMSITRYQEIISAGSSPQDTTLREKQNTETSTDFLFIIMDEFWKTVELLHNQIGPTDTSVNVVDYSKYQVSIGGLEVDKYLLAGVTKTDVGGNFLLLKFLPAD